MHKGCKPLSGVGLHEDVGLPPAQGRFLFVVDRSLTAKGKGYDQTDLWLGLKPQAKPERTSFPKALTSP